MKFVEISTAACKASRLRCNEPRLGIGVECSGEWVAENAYLMAFTCLPFYCNLKQGINPCHLFFLKSPRFHASMKLAHATGLKIF